MNVYGLIILIFLFAQSVQAQISFETVAKFPAEEAHQAVAVDSGHFYAIASRSIGKYDKKTGDKVAEWREAPEGPVQHLDSGVVVNGKLYAAHSNFPDIPMTSSVEVWDSRTLEHTGTHSFGIRMGSLTWIDRHNGSWWGTFAHYERFKNSTGKDNRWTVLVRFDDEWNILDSWVFPDEVLARFGDFSNSGGSWGPDGLLYATGHDEGEVYLLKVPDSGSVLELVEVVPVENEGQGIAWDRAEGDILYSIKRSSREVVVSHIKR